MGKENEMPNSSWINAEALATYIVGVISTLVVMLGWRLFNIKRPRKIVCQQTSVFSLVEIDKRIKPRITVIWDKGKMSEREVEKLSQTIIDISNTSKDTIDDVKIKFEFNVPIIETALNVPSELQDDEVRVILSPASNSSSREIIFSTPYLNSSKLYKETVELTVLTSGEPKVKVTGGGRDWKAYYMSIDDRQREAERRIYITSLTVTSIAILAFSLGPAWSGLSLKGILVGFLLAGIVGFLANRILWRWGLALMRPFFKS